MDKDGVMRLLDFVLSEATIKSNRGEDQPWEKMSQTVGMALREASNWALSERPLSPAKFKSSNPVMSRSAWELKGDVSHKNWMAKTRLEHWEPITQLWSWSVRALPSKDEILSRMRKWPIVTVTKDEDSRLRNEFDPETRYRMAGIEVGKVENGIWSPLVAKDLAVQKS